MATRTGKIILAKKINLDRSHNNVLSYTETQMVNLLSSNTHLIAQKTDSSFIREKNAIDVEVNFGTAIQSNYLAFQNPDYSNKWFFAFVTDIQYINNATTRIFFEVDDFATWWDYWSPNACFVVREHTNDDTVGNNVLPENVEMGPYVLNGTKENFGLGSLYYVLIATQSPNQQNFLATNVGGIPVAGGVFVFQYWQQMVNAINQYSRNQALNSIVSAYAVPYTIFDSNDLEFNILSGQAEIDENVFYRFTGTSSPKEITKTLSTPSKINGYTPKNNKLLTSPFQYLVMTNGGGGSANTLSYELFSNRSSLTFKMLMIPSIGCSIFAYPQNYKGITDDYNDGLVVGKYPTLSWSGDAYTNWLTQNSVNIGMGIIDNGENAIKSMALLTGSGGNLGLALTGASGLQSVGTNIANQVKEIYQHSLVPLTVRGNINGGDVATVMQQNDIFFLPMSIQASYAQRIDDYFSRMGYATNKIKVPNQLSRTYWNYVQIASSDDIGHSNQNISVPANAMENINNMYRAGITIWHDHANIGNYSLNNTIVS